MICIVQQTQATDRTHLTKQAQGRRSFRAEQAVVVAVVVSDELLIRVPRAESLFLRSLVMKQTRFHFRRFSQSDAKQVSILVEEEVMDRHGIVCQLWTGKIVGCVLANVQSQLLQIRHIYVRPRYRQQQIASQMMMHLGLTYGRTRNINLFFPAYQFTLSASICTTLRALGYSSRPMHQTWLRVAGASQNNFLNRIYHRTIIAAEQD